MSKDVLIFIQHILENIKDIEDFSRGVNAKKFEDDLMRQKAIIKSIEIIGEASKNVPEKIKNNYSSIPWKDIVGMRDKLVHHYFGVDLIAVWKVVKEDIPNLKKKILKVKKDLEKNDRH